MYVRRFSEIGRDDTALVGGKGANLGELTNAGVAVPNGFVLTTDAYRAFVDDNDLETRLMDLIEGIDPADPAGFDTAAARIEELFEGGRIPDRVAAALLDAYAVLGEEGCDCGVAVRSSATAEDTDEASFAGQQETYLNVHGRQALLRATQRCWASLWTARAMSYRGRQHIDPATVTLAVVVQCMVPADASGVMFTADPTSGDRGRAVISAAWGLGESVVGGTVTTDDVTVEKATGRLTDRVTASKDVMTVALDQGTGERPVPDGQRTRAVLTDGQAADLAALGARIEQHFGAPQDIEWALADGEFAIVQSRPITTLAPDIDWNVPHRHWMYVRGSIIEQMPDPLSPLFADLTGRFVVPALRGLVEELVPGARLDMHDVTFPTLHGYAYYAYSPLFLLRFTAMAPRMAPAAFGSGRTSGQVRWEQTARPRYRATVAAWDRRVEDLTAGELLEGVEALVAAGFRYYSSVQAIIPAAATAEMLFAGVYNRFLKRPGDPSAETFLLGFDSEPLRADKSIYDLAGWARDQPGLVEALARPGGAPPEVDSGEWEEFHRRLDQHLERFGHAIYNMDILNPVPADDPAPVLETLRFYLSGQGRNPHQRQQELAERREQATVALTRRLPAQVAKVVTKLLTRAQDLAPVREDALADVGLGWPGARRLALELGRRLCEAGALAAPDGVFWLTLDELTGLAACLDAGALGQADSDANAADHQARVAARQGEWRQQRLLKPPGLLPERSWGQSFARLMPEVMEQQRGPVLKGIGASGGRVTAPARVLQGPADFGSMRPGEVLVASITTPAWTPLFAMASAVVTDIGGPLSHSSIVAREYGIPAVLGTGLATTRIRTGQEVTVDGEAGVVRLDASDGEGDDGLLAPLVAPATRSPWPWVAAGAGLALAVALLCRRGGRRP